MRWISGAAFVAAAAVATAQNPTEPRGLAYHNYECSGIGEDLRKVQGIVDDFNTETGRVTATGTEYDIPGGTGVLFSQTNTDQLSPEVKIEGEEDGGVFTFGDEVCKFIGPSEPTTTDAFTADCLEGSDGSCSLESDYITAQMVRTAYLSMQIANWVYDIDEDDAPDAPLNPSSTVTNVFKRDDSSFSDNSAVVRYDDVCFVAFEGTETTDPGDITSDLNLGVTDFVGGVEVFEGFLEYFEGLRDDTLSAHLDEINNGGCTKSVITGHSLGGGAAQLYAFYVLSEGLITPEMSTIELQVHASVKPWASSDSATIVEDSFERMAILRWQVDGDLVPSFPDRGQPIGVPVNMDNTEDVNPIKAHEIARHIDHLWALEEATITRFCGATCDASETYADDNPCAQFTDCNGGDPLVPPNSDEEGTSSSVNPTATEPATDSDEANPSDPGGAAAVGVTNVGAVVLSIFLSLTWAM
eukprot:Clim_evm6s151 gene=Clim_evmTU6s151